MAVSTILPPPPISTLNIKITIIKTSIVIDNSLVLQAGAALQPLFGGLAAPAWT